MVLKFYPWTRSVKLVMQAFTVPCFSSLLFPLEMLPYLSSPMYSVIFFILPIRGGVGYLPLTNEQKN